MFFLNSFVIKCKLISIYVQGITKYNLPKIICRLFHSSNDQSFNI